MRNQPVPVYAPDLDERLIDADGPGTRFALLGLIFLLPLVVICGRLAYVQVGLNEYYIDAWETVEKIQEPIPARDGRILSADGLVLADVRPQFDLEVNYRWLEEPSNETWLRGEARGRLTRSQRRSQQEVDRAIAEVLSEKEELWSRLSEQFAIPGGEMSDQRGRIQNRVERMVASVEQRRERKQRDDEVQQLNWKEGAVGIWKTLVHELTTSPRRRDEPVILREEVSSHVVLSDITSEQAALLQSLPSHFPGVTVRVAKTRVYPEKELALHVLGIRRRRDGERQSRGENGVELAYDRVLTGRSGVKEFEQDRHGEILGETVLAEPVDGEDVVLTLDAKLQKAAERLLERTLQSPQGDSAFAGRPPMGGAIAAIDVRTGEMLVMASGPSVSQDVMLAPSTEQWDRIQHDVRRPLFNRVTQGAVAPGSTFTLLSSIALLQNKTFAPNEDFFCQGYLSSPDQYRCALFIKHGVGHGQLTLPDAIAQSCNVYFFEAGRRMGPTPLVLWAQRFGFGQPTGIDLPGEASGHLPNPFHLEEREQWHSGMTLQLAIGQGTLTTTPLQLLRFTAVLANGGTLITPRLVRSHSDANASEANAAALLEPEFAPQVAQMNEETLKVLREGMQLAITHPQGTAQLAYENELPCAGKAGTAQTGGDRPDHAWFVGYTPIENPRVAFVVFLEQGGSGSEVAAPIAREFLIELAQAGYIPLD
ncbi:MAG: hypothetical protein KDA88_11325 [Planctomycetaceae bacterium]|nr:hypothetical protein [Planctomycetaceae bacterium]MCB9952546.1 hypothetical protein [Planctomycetaceae bacterium]